MSNKELSQKATLALSDLTSDGGMLTVEQNNVFIRKLMDAPTLLNEVRTVPMNGPTMELNKIGFGSRILRAASQVQGSRALVLGDRSKPSTSKVNLATKEVIAEIRLPYEVLEDNVERGDMENTILALIADRAALDLEELLLSGDTGSGDAYLALMDGVLKLATLNIVDAAGAPISANVFNNAVKALPTRYRRQLNVMRHYVPMDVEQDYRLALSNRGSTLGDDILTGNRPVPVFGAPMRGAALMPLTRMLFTDPRNIIFGIQRNVRLESARLIAEREVQIVMTARCAIAIEETEAMTKVINLG